jgi:hypothetical protein
MTAVVSTSIRCADVTPSTVSWLWEPYLARGKLSVLDGDPGTGKSFITIDLAARLTSGRTLPGSTESMSPSPVLVLNAEDDIRDTILPRAKAAGADLGKLHVLAAPGLGLDRLPSFPKDLESLQRSILETGAAFVIVDSMMAFFPPAVSANNDQCFRQALTPLAELAASTGACILFVRHLRKAGGASAIYRGLGSIGIMGAMRTGLMISRHPDDPDLRVLTLSKTNIGPPARSFGFRLEKREEDGQTYVNWTGALDLPADDLFGTSVPLRAGSRTRERAGEWLRTFLAKGPRRAQEVFEAARAAGFADRTLNRIKDAIGIESRAVRKKGVTEWWWHDAELQRQKERDEIREMIGDLPGFEPF